VRRGKTLTLGVILIVARSLHEVLQSISDVMFPGDPERCPTVDSVGHDGDSPLHVLAWRNDLEGVQLLIDAGANVNATGEMDETPLHIAVTQENVPMVRALLAAGARDDARCEFGDTPRERALLRGGATARLFRESR
jgi:ankyrin repeat protein